ncbi:MAG TPA: hypothetical protein VKR53_15365 [Puia sp.]|nr:hypothetical protein [Puia sp.]
MIKSFRAKKSKWWMGIQRERGAKAVPVSIANGDKHAWDIPSGINKGFLTFAS